MKTLRKKITKKCLACCIAFILLFLNSHTLYAATEDSETSEVTIQFSATAEPAITVYRPEDGKYDHEMTPAAKQVLVYARAIKFGTVLKPALATASYNSMAGVIGIQASDTRTENLVSGGWKITATLSKFKDLTTNNSATFTSGAKLTLSHGDLLVGPVRGDSTDAALPYNVTSSPAAAVAMDPTVVPLIELIAGGTETKIAGTGAKNSPFAWVIRWTGTPDTNGNGGVQLTITDATEINNTAYAATILWKFHNTP